jgi:hypothetical protein
VFLLKHFKSARYTLISFKMIIEFIAAYMVLVILHLVDGLRLLYVTAYKCLAIISGRGKHQIINELHLLHSSISLTIYQLRKNNFERFGDVIAQLSAGNRTTLQLRLARKGQKVVMLQDCLNRRALYKIRYIHEQAVGGFGCTPDGALVSTSEGNIVGCTGIH